jgi:hypothetical protein
LNASKYINILNKPRDEKTTTDHLAPYGVFSSRANASLPGLFRLVVPRVQHLLSSRSEINNTLDPALDWNCTATGGRYGTAGVYCSGFKSGTSYNDTSWLFTPAITIEHYPKVYLQFDTKYHILYSKEFAVDITDSSETVRAAVDTNFGWAGDPDTSDWKTVQYDITSFTHSYSPVEIAFRYSSSSAQAGIWTIDNVRITTTPLAVGNVSRTNLPITIAGNCNSSTISFQHRTGVAAIAGLQIYDMLGRLMCSQLLDVMPEKTMYEVHGLQLQPGMYLLKLEDGGKFGYAKCVIN